MGQGHRTRRPTTRPGVDRPEIHRCPDEGWVGQCRAESARRFDVARVARAVVVVLASCELWGMVCAPDARGGAQSGPGNVGGRVVGPGVRPSRPKRHAEWAPQRRGGASCGAWCAFLEPGVGRRVGLAAQGGRVVGPGVRPSRPNRHAEWAPQRRGGELWGLVCVPRARTGTQSGPRSAGGRVVGPGVRPPRPNRHAEWAWQRRGASCGAWCAPLAHGVGRRVGLATQGGGLWGLVCVPRALGVALSGPGNGGGGGLWGLVCAPRDRKGT
ncbi:hypothetical protein SAMN04487917_102321 [Arthrobacter sp. yr096]|nr:hypothetical protein SAMN04487917_102321 [Arthrobacter sp. yr096]